RNFPAVRLMLVAGILSVTAGGGVADEAPTGELAAKLAGVTFESYATAPGYSEGPVWRDGEILFCSGALLRVDTRRRVHPYLDINPAGTVLLVNGHVLVCDSKYRALLDVSPHGKVPLIAEPFRNGQLPT